MKDRVFKAVWVDRRGRLRSVMAGVRGSYGSSRLYLNRPLTYSRGKIVTSKSEKPYLFAFASVETARKFVCGEFISTPNSDGNFFPWSSMELPLIRSRYNKGHVEIWEAEGELLNVPKKVMDPTLNIGTEFYDSYIAEFAPQGTLLCRSIKLIDKVVNVL